MPWPGLNHMTSEMCRFLTKSTEMVDNVSKTFYAWKVKPINMDHQKWKQNVQFTFIQRFI